MNIKQIKISGFKSIADIELNELAPYSVFAGANGSGKSNFFDALQFISAVISLGATKALRKFNGYEQVHCFKSRKSKARTFSASFDLVLDDKLIQYQLKIHEMDKDPKLEERLSLDNIVFMSRKKEEVIFYDVNDEEQKFSGFPSDKSALMISAHPLYELLSNIVVYRFDPIGAKEPDSSSTDQGELEQHGRNVATMLAGLEKDDVIREQIIEWMELLVPGLEKVATERQKLDARTVIKFKEEGTKANFPANLISDGTIYALCIMTAVLSRSKGLGMTLIEEPERGIHPKAITELVNLMRDNANSEHPIFVTTHNESLIRVSKPNELWLVNKRDGKTEIENTPKNFIAKNGLKLDEAWLMNMFDGGLPW
ncbi:AAA family ATPase [Methylobacter tundripaludum]|uniref:AAA family ATPase n=1 Tax=Methylobacter tundripaludum TaxID=173365 RepID=UPI00047F50C6|nr:AAA family ATPase [Methylobacter tundripaludum]